MEQHRIIRRVEVEKRTGLARSTIYQLMKDGVFPSAVKIGNGAVGWVESEIDQYIVSCISRRDCAKG